MKEFIEKFPREFIAFFLESWVFVGILLIALIFIFLVILFKYFKKKSFFILFDLFFEKIYEFFESVLWEKENKYIKSYVIWIFFLILISNMTGVLLEFLVPIFWHGMEHYIKIPTADINFNIAMAVVWIFVILFEQLKMHWFWHFVYDYFPIFWKNYIPYKRGSLPIIIDIPLFLLVKIFDIGISLFLWVLEIIWIWAKIISLSFRLFGNVTSWGILLMMLYWALSWFTIEYLTIDFPIILPLIVYLQEFLVAFIQALVFPLLIAIFIKVAKISV